MQHLYLISLLCITALGTFFAGVYAKQLVAFYKRLFTRKKRNQIEYLQYQIDELNKILNYDREYCFRVEDKVNINHLTTSEQINNVAEKISNREKNLKKQIRTEVINYLKEIQNG